MKKPLAVITGGSRGLGLAMGEALVAAGFVVEAWDLSPGEARSGIHFRQVNVTDEASVKAASDACVAQHGVPRALICNAGITRDALAHKMSTEIFDQVVAVNLRGTFLPCQVLGKAMRDANADAQKKGEAATWRRILTISSVAGLFGNVGQLNYAASKAGVVGIAKTLAKEWGRFNISVSSIAPGVMSTEMTKTIPEEVMNGFIERTPLRRTGKPEELAAFVRFLCQEDSAFLTGDVIAFSGGLLL
ncbi:MAG TPA: SDR family oxidoreductase [Bdellovibrionota bacterium]|jgi:3-oxoacyl-[acyl-carrier protein] reductase|nr:SDR family oxidoreductase [Bdellovibrionota bacterium]